VFRIVEQEAIKLDRKTVKAIWVLNEKIAHVDIFDIKLVAGQVQPGLGRGQAGHKILLAIVEMG
jgi:hypothetical protein